MDPLLARFVERIAAVLIGGMAIYLGFRLFREVPEHRGSAGKFALPWDISIAISGVGPGGFFALFGVAAVSLALIRPLEISSRGPGPSGEEGERKLSYMGGSAPGDQTARADARRLLRREIAYLNTIPQQLRGDLAEHSRNATIRALARVKFLLMRPAWGEPEEGFGDIAEFERWVQAGEPDPPPKGMEGALALYRYGRTGP